MMPPAMRWGFIFLACPLPLTEDQKEGLVLCAARAYFEELDALPFNWGACRGEVRPASDTVLLGTFYGQRFTAEVHLPDRSGTVDFLVTEAQLRAAHAEIAEA
ncbi:MAG: hypothetical protein H6739_26135 [Alphaproteobacteria bacterium]|nr:hypothetical protein [Alphaproteobacteria bacterium]